MFRHDLEVSQMSGLERHNHGGDKGEVVNRTYLLCHFQYPGVHVSPSAHGMRVVLSGIASGSTLWVFRRRSRILHAVEARKMMASWIAPLAGHEPLTKA